jgi:hypothetical protein
MKLQQRRLGVDAVRLVYNQDTRLAGAPQRPGNYLVSGIQTLTPVNQEKHQVCLFNGLPGLPGHQAVEVFPAPREPTGIDHDKRSISNPAIPVFPVTRQPRNIRDQRIPRPGHLVE